MKEQNMKRLITCVVLLLSGGGLVANAASSVVTWTNIAGVITAPGSDNPVAVTKDQSGRVLSQISSGTLPWVTKSGMAVVNLSTGEAQFSVSGLVLNGGNTSGTAAPINQVTGTLVCNPGSTRGGRPQAILDTPPVALTAEGDAIFSGELTAPVPSPCNNPLFLIRIGPAFGDFAGRWLATGVVPRFDR